MMPFTPQQAVKALQTRAEMASGFKTTASALADKILEALPQWQPIETAPTEEYIHTVLLSRNTGKRGVMPAYFNGTDWIALGIVSMPYKDPTHWMPLPPAPEQREEAS